MNMQSVIEQITRLVVKLAQDGEPVDTNVVQKQVGDILLGAQSALDALPSLAGTTLEKSIVGDRKLSEMTLSELCQHSAHEFTTTVGYTTIPQPLSESELFIIRSSLAFHGRALRGEHSAFWQEKFQDENAPGHRGSVTIDSDGTPIPTPFFSVLIQTLIEQGADQGRMFVNGQWQTYRLHN